MGLGIKNLKAKLARVNEKMKAACGTSTPGAKAGQQVLGEKGAVGLGWIWCPCNIATFHVCPREVIDLILKDGFKPSTDPSRCRIGGGVYTTNSRNVAEHYKKHQETKETKGYAILTCLVKTKGGLTDFGSVNVFDAGWPHATSVACGQHFPAMGMDRDERFSEYVSQNSRSVIVLEVDGNKPRLPTGSVMLRDVSRWYKGGKPNWKSKIIELANGMRCKEIHRNGRTRPQQGNRRRRPQQGHSRPRGNRRRRPQQGHSRPRQGSERRWRQHR